MTRQWLQTAGFQLQQLCSSRRLLNAGLLLSPSAVTVSVRKLLLRPGRHHGFHPAGRRHGFRPGPPAGLQRGGLSQELQPQFLISITLLRLALRLRTGGRSKTQAFRLQRVSGSRSLGQTTAMPQRSSSRSSCKASAWTAAEVAPM